MRLYQLEDLSILQKHMVSSKIKMKAIQVCTNRFDDDTKTSFTDLYTKVDSGASVEKILADKKAAEEAEILSEKKSDDSEEDVEDDFNV